MAARRSIGYPDGQQMVEFLQSGVVLAATGSSVDDAIEPPNTAISRLEMLTDGDWVWPADLSYYVAIYPVVLPDVFVTYVRGRNYLVGSSI